jgi:hypothetical protein
MRPERAAGAYAWAHHVDHSGRATTRCRATQGADIDGDRLRSVCCRLAQTSVPRFARSSARDRDYAAIEMQALLVSWLASLPCPLYNPVDGNGLVGRLSEQRWLDLALRQGLAVSPWLMASNEREVGMAERPLQQIGLPGLPSRRPVTYRGRGEHIREVHVIGDRVMGEVSAMCERGLIGVARASGCPVLSMQITHANADEPDEAVVSISPAGNLDALAIDALADLMATDSTGRGRQ